MMSSRICLPPSCLSTFLCVGFQGAAPNDIRLLILVALAERDCPHESPGSRTQQPGNLGWGSHYPSEGRLGEGWMPRGKLRCCLHEKGT